MMTNERADTLERLIAEHNQSTAWTDELLSAARESIKLREALKAQPEDSRGCTCKSMISYDCPFHLLRAALEAK